MRFLSFRRGSTVCSAWAALALLAAWQPAIAQPAAVQPPRPLERVEATYPAEALSAGEAGTVVLLVTVEATGAVGAVEVLSSAGERLDQAAVEAMRGWRFEPARRGEATVATRIRVPFTFALPTPTPTPAPVAQARPTRAEPANADDVVDVTVRGRRAVAPRATSDFVLEKEALTAAPKQNAADLLATAPGVYVSQPEGEAVAHEIYLRGFNAEHGQDVELSVGVVPLNQPAHLHGQGYADLNVVVPETVRSLRVTEGVYDPRQGDFAVAGSVDFDLGVAERGTHLKTTAGSFGTFRQLLLWAPPGEQEETFGAFALRTTRGFGDNRGALSGAATAQYAFDLPGGYQALFHAAAAGARASLAGILRRDDVQAGAVDFYGSYPDATAQSQSAFSSRTQLALSVERPEDNGARTAFAVWTSLTDFRSRENFTGYLERARLRPEVVGRGDLIEQENHARAVGLRASQRTPRWQRNGLGAQLELGLAARTDAVDQAQNLLQAPQNETWDQRVDATVRGSDLGGYLDGELRFGRWLVRGGVRADVLHYDIDDRLGNFIPAFQRQTHLIGFRRTATGVAAGPRLTAQWRALDPLTVLAAYGEGYRSPQPRLLEEGENAPFTKVRALELGGRYEPSAALGVTAAGYATFLSNDLAFDPGEGRLEPLGPTRRLGAVLHVQGRPLRGWFLSASATYVHATLQAPPPATAANPVPVFTRGELLPYVPPLLLRADSSVEGAVGSWLGSPLRGRAGLGATVLSARPLPYRQHSAPVFLVDGAASLRWRAVEVGVEVFNLLGARYAASEYAFVSNWQTQPVPSLLPARHFAAGAPRAVNATFALHF